MSNDSLIYLWQQLIQAECLNDDVTFEEFAAVMRFLACAIYATVDDLANWFTVMREPEVSV